MFNAEVRCALSTDIRFKKIDYETDDGPICDFICLLSFVSMQFSLDAHAILFFFIDSWDGALYKYSTMNIYLVLAMTKIERKWKGVHYLEIAIIYEKWRPSDE